MKKTLIISTPIILVAAIASVAFAIPKDQPTQESNIVSESVDKKVEAKNNTVSAPEAPQEHQAVESTPNTQTAPEAVIQAPVQPQVLSTQAYAEMYLDLSGRNQHCLDYMVNKWPHRFTEDVRENNIKALTVWAGVCTTGIDNIRHESGRGYGGIYTYGQDGEFFDSDFAKSKH
jgi:hypothetical protein